MLDDLTLINMDLPRSWDRLRVYFLGDLHVGSKQFNETAVRKMVKIIADDEQSCVAVCGDCADFGLKNSKTNVYESTIPNPKDQLMYVKELLDPIASKISAFVPGNHEYRITRETGLCPGYDLCVLWGIQERYRENLAITKYSFGSIRGKSRKVTFIGLTSHGTSRNKSHKFVTSSFDNADFSATGHCHSPWYVPDGKIKIDPINSTAKWCPFAEVIVNPTLTPGGYGLKNQYELAAPPELQYLELYMDYDTDENRTQRRIMNYHSIKV